MSSDLNPTGRFSDRVGYYVKYRPRYARDAIEFFVQQAGLEPPDPIADVGSGTGILAEAFLGRGYTVYGVEPNAEMRAAGEDFLRGYDQFISIDGTAEQTTLDTGAVNAITCGQSFHWFDLSLTKKEFQRILQPGGLLGLLWNTWQHQDSPLVTAYRALMTEFGTEYNRVAHTRIGETDYQALFQSYERVAFPNPISYDLDALKGRALSSSYAPLPGHPNHAPMMTALDAFFAEFEKDGVVTFHYETEVFYGKL